MKFTSNGTINMFLLYIIVNSIGKVISLVDLNYPSAISLDNGNIFIIEKNGILVYDEQLNNIIYNYRFTEQEQITDSTNVNMKQKNNYVICLVNSIIYFFDYEKRSINKFTNLIDDDSINHPAITLINSSDINFFYYVIGYIFNENNMHKLKLLYYKIEYEGKSNIYIDKEILTDCDGEYIENKGQSCEYMKTNNDIDNYLVCFFIIKSGNILYLAENFFDISDTTLSIIDGGGFDPAFVEISNINDIIQVKSIINNDRTYSLICFQLADGRINYATFYFEYKYIIGFETHEEYFSEIFSTNLNCNNSLSGMKLNYLLNTSQIILSCIDSLSTIKALLFKFDDFEKLETYEKFSQCESMYDHSIINLNQNSTLYVISDVKCQNYKRCFEPLIGDLTPIKVDTTMYINNESPETTLIIEEEIICDEKCKECDKKSKENNLCISCNNEKNFYYLNHIPSNPRGEYIDCVNKTTKPPRYYLNAEDGSYEPCYINCASCEYGGNYELNNCSTCDGVNYIKNPDNENSTNCLIKCKYYYYLFHDIYTCTSEPSCPFDYNYIIKNKSKCIDDCKNDNEYKYRYNGECFKHCPNNTQDNNDYICKDINNECILTENSNGINSISDNISLYDVEYLVIRYINEFKYTDNHVSIYTDGDYTITIYIKSKCILELELGIPEYNFGLCYEKVLNVSQTDKLIIVIIDKKITTPEKKRKVIKYGMFSPLTGQYLNSDEICAGDTIIISEDFGDKLMKIKMNIQTIKDFANDGINVFDLSCPFYNDLCYQYNSTKDVALKDRILLYFPNITLCEDGCKLQGINITSLTSICKCLYTEAKKENNFKNKVLEQIQLGTLEEMINSSNLYVIKCIKLIFDINISKKCYGAFIIIGFILIEIICTIYYCSKNIFQINKYIFILTNKYIYTLPRQQDKKDVYLNIQDLDKIRKQNMEKIENKIDDGKNYEKIINKKRKSRKKHDINKNFQLIIYDEKKMKLSDKNLDNNDQKSPKDKFQNYSDFSNLSGKDLFSERKLPLPNDNNSLFSNINDDMNINIAQFLETQLDDMDYDESIRKDHRKFCEFFVDKLKHEQIFLNTFYSNEPIKPRAIKIILLIFQLNIYLFVNGLFYDEEYISKIYHLEKDTFITKAERFVDKFIYTAFSSIIISYIVEFIFIDEMKIKRILKYEKDNIIKLKYEINQILKSIKLRYLFFIILAFIISLFSLIHIACFNIVYYHIMKEWIIFSVVIILSIQIGTVLLSFLQTCLRFLSYKFKNEKLFKLSQV